jgi:2-(3-amino-3-carboxypropyl)histidine synthase
MEIPLEPTRNTPKCGTVVKVKSKVRKNVGSIPDTILKNVSLNDAINILPRNYNFEIHKCLWKILTDKVTTVALQFPEGLLMYSCIISDILSRFSGVKIVILGDVTYGACCIDDFTASKLGASLLIHYGHSCLVPVNVTRIKVKFNDEI